MFILYFCQVSWIGKIYKRNVYGVIGTLVFHILLVSTFLLADINMKGNVKEDEILIEFPDILEPEIEEEPEESEQNETESIPENSTNVASNRLSRENTTQSAEEFIDDDFFKEVEAAKELVSNVNKQLSKKVVDLDDIKMPVETTEGIDRDSIKNIIYVGESNIVYYLENRYHIELPKPIYLAQGGGKVIVDITVNQSGRVTEAVARENKAIRDQKILEYAQIAASRTIFNEDLSAPKQQRGTIHYTFVAQ